MKKSMILLLAIGFCFGCHNANNKNNQQTTSNIQVTLPKPDHIIIVIDENKGYNEIINTPQTPYISRLAKEGALFTDSHGVQHPSQPNYLAFFSGSTQGTKGDECLQDSTPFTTPNLGAALLKAGYTFKGYAQTMPSVGYLPCYYQKSTLTKAYLYGRKHCPWVNWTGNRENNFPDSLSRPFTDFPTDSADFSKLPTVTFVIPDMDHDMHNNIPNVGSDTTMIKMGDTWLQQNLSKYIDWAQTHNSLFILTFDEDNFTPQNHIPTIFVGPMVKPGEYNDSINHYNVLRTIEAMYKLSPSGPAQASAITNVWK